VKYIGDTTIAASIGLSTGIFIASTLLVREIAITFQIALICLAPAILFPVGVILGKFLGEKVHPFFKQFGKFAVTGFLGASIDFLGLNILSKATEVASGASVGWINIPGFLIAVLVVYSLNKFWSFNDKKPLGATPDTSTTDQRKTDQKSESLLRFFKIFDSLHLFLIVVATGLLLNSAVVIAITSIAHAQTGPSAIIWLNIAKVIASAVSLLWNFFGYRNIVFRPSSKPLWPRSQS